MIKTKEVLYENEIDRSQILELYVSSFPDSERRSLERISFLWQYKNECTFHGIYEEEEFIGFFVVWDCDFFSFFEYIAIKKEERGKGSASLILSMLLNSGYSPAICEVEIPELVEDSSMAERRISFYKKLGWEIIDIAYLLPPLKEGDIEFPFYLMSHGEHTRNIEEIVKQLYKVVYKVEKE